MCCSLHNSEFGQPLTFPVVLDRQFLPSFNGPSLFTDLYFLAWHLLAQPCSFSWLISAIDIQEAAYFTLCLQPAAQKQQLGFSFLLETKRLEVLLVSNTWGCCH